MAVLDELLSRIFLSLENFFQKVSELDVFEDFLFSYKIKLLSVEKCSSQFLSTFLEFHDQMQLAVKECMYISDDRWNLNYNHQIDEHIVNDSVTVVDDNHTLVQTSSPAQVTSDPSTLLAIPVEIDNKSCIEIRLNDDVKASSQSLKLQQTCQPNSIVHLSESTKYQNEVSSNSIPSQDDVALLSTGTNSLRNNINGVGIFKCNLCLRKFRSSIKLTKHSCKKRIDKIGQQVTINAEAINCRNISLNIDESMTISVDGNEFETRKVEDTILTTDVSICSSDPIIPKTPELCPPLCRDENQFPNEEADLPVYSCSLCCISFLERSRWDDHVCKEKEGTTNCQRGIVATRLLLEERHWFICGFCSETYRSLGRIIYHLTRCFAGPYLCEVCASSFTTRSELNYHKKKQHKGVESFFCDDCGLGFKLRTSLQKHLINRHENLQGEYHCDIGDCQQVFPKKIFLTHHKINEHRLEGKYLCQICGNKFYNPCSLSSHLETHSDKKQFICPICCRVLKTKEKLTLHIRTHTGERPFSCTICGKSFIAKSKLEEHSRRHRGEKRHKCSNCGKLYANGFDLKQHVKKCNPKRDDLKDHIRVNKNVNESLSSVMDSSKVNDMIALDKNKNQSQMQNQVTKLQPFTSRQVINRKDNVMLYSTPASNISNNVENVTNAAISSCPNSSTANGSGMIIQLDSNGRVMPLQTTAVHVVDYAPYYPSPDPIHIVMPPQTLVLTGYDNITY